AHLERGQLRLGPGPGRGRHPVEGVDAPAEGGHDVPRHLLDARLGRGGEVPLDVELPHGGADRGPGGVHGPPAPSAPGAFPGPRGRAWNVGSSSQVSSGCMATRAERPETALGSQTPKSAWVPRPAAAKYSSQSSPGADVAKAVLFHRLFALRTSSESSRFQCASGTRRA